MAATDTDGPRVVVGVDGSKGARLALEWALDYVRRTGGRLTAVAAWHHVLTPVRPVMPSAAGSDAEEAARHTLEELLRAVDTSGVGEIRQVVQEGAAAPVLIEESREADLLVVGNRGHGGFTGMLLGSVSTHCTHHAVCPVVVVRG